MLFRPKSIAIVLCLVVAACSDGGGDSMSTPLPQSPSPSPSPPPSPSPSAGGAAVTVEILDFEFSPKSVTIEPGETVRWVLRGTDTTHTTIEQNELWRSGPVFMQNGDSFEHTFTAEDDGRTFLYYCSSHRGCCQMQGSIRVGSSAPPQPDDY